MDPIDRWIFSRLAATVENVNKSFADLEFQSATGALHFFWWSNFCDFYLEASKPGVWSKDSRILPRISANFWQISETFFRLLSPFMPFLAAELYRRIPGREKFQIHDQKFPQNSDFSQFFHSNLESQGKMAEILVNVLRSVRKDFEISIKIPMNAQIFGLDSSEILENFSIIFQRLANFRLNFEIPEKNEKILFPEKTDGILIPEKNEILIPVDSKINLKIQFPNDFEVEKIFERFERQILKKEKNLAFLERQQKSFKYSLPETEFESQKSILIQELDRLNQLLNQFRINS